jgi:hypothetical protein
MPSGSSLRGQAVLAEGSGAIAQATPDIVPCSLLPAPCSPVRLARLTGEPAEAPVRS